MSINKSSPVQLNTAYSTTQQTPKLLSNDWAQVSIGSDHTLAIKNDGTLWSWGSDSYGQLGKGTMLPTSSPVQIGTSSWSQVSAGDDYSLAIDVTGKLYGWGKNSSGQVGNDKPMQSDFWLKVTGNGASIFGIRRDKSLWSWGLNTTGELGLFDVVYRSSPTQIGSSSWSVIASNYVSAAGIDTNGRLFTWGYNAYGQLGDSSTINKSSPIQLGTGKWESIATPGYNTTASYFYLAIRTDKSLWGWGSNSAGTLGQGDVANRSSPVQVASDKSWASVAAGDSYAIAITTTGSMWAWGGGVDGRLGDGTTLNRISPVQLGTQSWTQVSLGLRHALAIRNDGTLWSWGQNSYGQLGIGLATARSSPVQVGAATNWKSVFAFEQSSYAIDSNDVLYAWGNNTYGQLNTGTNVHRSSPVQLSGSWTSVSAISVPVALAAMAILTDKKSEPETFGVGYIYQNVLGNPSIPNTAGRSSPVQLGVDYLELLPVQIGSSSWTQVSAGFSHSTAIKSDGSLWAWGKANEGQLGESPEFLIDRSSPVQVSISNSFTLVEAGKDFTLALDTNDRLYTWGDNMYGQLGYNSLTDLKSWKAIASQNQHTLAISSDDKLYTWGRNNYGQLGDGTTLNKSSPTQIGTKSWIMISSDNGYSNGTGSSAAIDSDNKLWMWGLNTNGQLGNGTTINRSSPVQVGNSSWVSVSSGNSHTIAVDSSGRLFGWGINNGGQVGDGTTINRSSPVQVGTATNWTKVKVGFDASFALNSANQLFGWGYGLSGQLGNGATTNRPTPIQIPGSWTAVFSNGVINTVFGIDTQNLLYGWGTWDDSALMGDLFSRSNPTQISGYKWKHVAVGGGKMFMGIRQDDTLWAWGTKVAATVTPQYSASLNFPNSWLQVSSSGSHSAAIRTDGRLFTWGLNTSGQLGDVSVVSRSSPVQVGGGSATVPAGPGHFWSQVACAGFQTYAIRFDGTLWVWGRNQQGVLGDGTTTNRSSPAQIGTSSWSQIAAGASHVLLLDTNKKLYGFGFNNYGQLTSPRSIVSITTPTLISSSSWIAIGAGLNYSAAINKDNELYTWGLNDYGQLGTAPTTYWREATNLFSATVFIDSNSRMFSVGLNTTGQLGDGTTVSRSEPVQISGSWLQASGLTSSVAAIRADNTLWTWGNNSNGQLGDNSTVNRSSPVQISGSWLAVEASDFSTVALKTDGTLWTWGSNINGQLGDSTTISRSSPAQVGSATWKKISVNTSTFLGIRNDDTIWGFGLNTSGQLADGTIINRSFPVQLRALGSTGLWKDVSAFGMGIASDNTLWTWGVNNYGQLGDITTVAKSSPIQIPGSWSAIAGSVTSDSRFAINADGTLWAWGRNITGVLVTEDTISRSSPIQIGSASYTSIFTSNNASYAIRADNTLWAWGLNTNNSLFLDGTTIARSSPIQVGSVSFLESPYKIDGSWLAVTAGNSHTVALKTDGTVWAWGSNSRYQLGLYNSDTLKPTPESAGELYVTNTGRLVTWGESGINLYPESIRTLTNPYLYYGNDLSFSTVVKTKLRNAGAAFAIRNNGMLFAWGTSTAGLVGDNTILFRSKPIQISSKSWTSVAAGASHALAIDSNNLLWGWGNGDNGSLALTSWKSVSASSSHAIAIRTDNIAFGWGLNTSGEIGDASGVSRSSPVQIGTLGWKQIEAGNLMSLGLTVSGSLYSWGSWMVGARGVWPSATGFGVANATAPVLVNQLSWKSISTRGYGSFAIKDDNTMYSWGDNKYGQLGLNSLGNVITPMLVNSTPVTPRLSLFSLPASQNQTQLIMSQVNSDIRVGTNDYTIELWSWWFDGPSGTGNSANIIEKTDSTGVTAWLINANPQNQMGVPGGYSFSFGGVSTFIQYNIGKGRFGTWNHIAMCRTGTNVNIFINGELMGSMTVPASVNDGTGTQYLYFHGRGITVSAFTTDVRITVGVAVYTGNFQVPTSALQLTQSAGTNISAISAGQVKYLGFVGGTVNDLSGTGAALEINALGPALYNFSPYTTYSTPFTPPGTSKQWAMVSTGISHTAAIDVDGKLWTTGYNARGELGLGDTVNRSAFTQVGNSSWIAVCAGPTGQTLAIKADNTLYTWGANYLGQLGQGDLNHRSSPTQLGTSSYIQVSAGEYNSAAERISGEQDVWGDNRMGQLLTTVSPGNTSWKLSNQPVGLASVAYQADNTLWLWGLNNYGQQFTGDIISTNRSSPTQLDSGPWKAFTSSNNSSSLAIKEDGTLWAAGLNTSGQLGTGDVLSRSYPVQIAGSWTMAAITRVNGMGIRTDGSLWTWGSNVNGELGVSDRVNRSSPVQVGTDSWKYVASGDGTGGTIYAIRNDDTLWAWGLGTTGQLGNGLAISRSAPIQIGSLSWNMVAAGSSSAVAIRSDYTLWSWGLNAQGQLGDNTVITRSSPVQIGVDSWITVSAQNSHVSAIKTDNTLWTWGLGTIGQLGNDINTSRSNPVQVAGLYSYTTVGASATYMVKTDGSLYAVGAQANYQLGDGTTVTRSSPVQVGAINTVFKSPVVLNSTSYSQAAFGRFAGYSLSSDNSSVFAWGSNLTGQVGDGTTINRSSPVQVGSTIRSITRSAPMQIGLSSWSMIAAGVDFSVGIRDNGTLWAWGVNTAGQVGNNSVVASSSMAQLGTGSWNYVSAGNSFAVAIRNDKTLWSWGSNANGQLGDNSIANRSSPVQIAGSYNLISSGGSFAVAIDTNGYLFTWGSNNAGQLGDSSTIDRSQPVQIGSDSWSFVSAGASHVMAVRNNTVYTWGFNLNTEGQLGDGFINSRSSPVAITSGIYVPSATIATSPTLISAGSYTSIAAGANHSMLVKNDNALLALGSNEFGQLGTNSVSQAISPVTVSTSVVSSFTQVAASGLGSIAISNPQNLLYNWGFNAAGQLGLSDTTNRSSPAQVATAAPAYILTPIKIQAPTTPATVNITSNATLLGTNGSIWSWGQGANGQLGTQNSIDNSSPVSVGANWQPFIASPRQVVGSWNNISAGNSHSLAISSTDKLFGWGSYAGSLTSTYSWQQVSAGTSHAAAIRSDGSLWLWGFNSTGQLGLGDTLTRYYPTKLGNQSWLQVSASGTFTYGLRSDGTVWCWGQNSSGQLGDGTTVNKSSPIQLGTGTDWKQIDTGGGAGYFMNNAGVIFATGLNTNGQIGDGTTITRSSPVQVPMYTDSYDNFAAGNNFVLAVDSLGSLWSWGDNAYGQLGTQSTVQYSFPAQTSTLQYYWSKVFAGGSSSFILDKQGRLYAFGFNTSGQLGLGDAINRSQPTLLGTDLWKAVSTNKAAGVATMFQREDDTIWTTGNGTGGLLASGSSNTRYTPFNVTEVYPFVNKIGGMGSQFAVFLSNDGTLSTAGVATNGVLGDGSSQAWEARSTPVQVSVYGTSSPVQLGSTNWSGVAAGNDVSLAVKKADNTLWSWGKNNTSQTGTSPEKMYVSSPTQVGTLAVEPSTGGPASGMIAKS